MSTKKNPPEKSTNPTFSLDKPTYPHKHEDELPLESDIFNRSPNSDHKKGPQTKITVKYDVGFNNSLYIRGKGANLSWDKGVKLRNIKSDEWVWETNIPFTTCEFKVLLNDKQYEIGENHLLSCGALIQYTPKF